MKPRPPTRSWRALADRPERLAAAALVFVTILLALSAVEVYREFRASAEVRAAVSTSYETRAQIHRVFSLLQDAETGQRGYVITGNPGYLDPYQSARRDLDRQMTRLETLFQDHPDQMARFRDLRVLVDLKNETLANAIEARRERGRDAADAVVISGEGKAVMDQIRTVIDALVAREMAELAQLSRTADQRTARTSALIIGLFTAFTVTLFMSVVMIWRHLVTRRALMNRMTAVMARQEAVFDSAMDAILTLNPSGSIESINPAGERMFGWSAPDLNRRDVGLLFDLADPGDQPFLNRIGASPESLEGGVLREMRARRRNGETFPIDVALGAMRLPTGVHLVAVVRDISERRRVEQMKAEFVSTVSHELRTPLTSIAGSLGLLSGGAGGALPEKAGRLIGIAHANAQRLVRLINDILDIEKLEAGKLELDIRPLDLREVAARAIDGASGYASELGVELRLIDGEGAPVRGDADRLIQVVTNLLSNAAKFSPKGGEVRVAVYREARIARLSVVDRGPGIPDAFRSRIFSKFAQADSSDTRTRGGTGLGLVIAREIAERHGGRLWFESAEGEGATFHLDLPLTIDEETPSGQGPRVLVVEDDHDAAATLRAMLEAEGLSVDCAATVRDALHAVETQAHVAALIDIGLPDGDGIGLIRSLRALERTRNLPVVVVSGDVARGRRRGRALEVMDWLDKPIDETRLRAAVTAIRTRTEAERPVILHVDDDRDILDVTRAALGDDAEVHGAQTLADARARLRHMRPDLVILDLGLPDGSGLDLLPDLEGGGRDVPVVVYSAEEADALAPDKVEAVMTKSRTSLTELVRIVRRISALKQEAR